VSYRLEPGEEPAAALRRIAGEQLDRAVAQLADDERDPHETIHDVRKRCKKVRGLLRLVRPAFPAYADENAALRDAARRVSALRDAAALVETCDALAARLGEEARASPLAALRAQLVERRDEFLAKTDLELCFEEVHEDLAAAAARADDWSLADEGFAPVGDGLARTYRRARTAMERALRTPTDEALHEWRKRVKYHRYHLRLLRELWPPLVDPRRDAARLLSDRLGDDHDLAVLRRVLVDESERFGSAVRDPLLALVDRRRGELSAWSRPLGLRLLAAKPTALRRELRQWWEAAAVERRLASTLPSGSERVC
jgi:CHAD domain-containing protein